MSKIAGSVLGLAFGDAFGYPTEFSSYEKLAATGFAEFPSGYSGSALISDDTQMALATMETVAHNYDLFVNPVVNEEVIGIELAESYVIWAHDPKNNRAPGNTCLTAIHIYENSNRENGYYGEQNQSKGCGANMRNPWFGLLPVKEDTIEHLSIIQSRTTHGHPLALSSAVLTALMTQAIYSNKVFPGEGYSYARHLTNELLNKKKPYLPEKYYQGLKDLAVFLNNAESHHARFMRLSEDKNYNICDFFGEGWVAEEAFLNAISGFDKFHDDPTFGLKRLANSSGDSDSLAAIGGAYLGAYAGNVWELSWKNSLEPDYLDRLENTIEFLEKVSSK